MPKTSKKFEDEIILEIYKQRYNQVQHFQQMRATYFNIYIVVIGFSVTAIFGFYRDVGQVSNTVALSLGGLIYIISLLSMMRAERWGGHIIHDLHTIRKIQNYYSSKNEAVAEIIPYNPKPLASLEFNRPLWNRNRSIETPTMMFGAILSAILVAYFLPIRCNFAIGFLLIVLPILVWQAEVSNLVRRHAKCCLQSSQEK